MNSASLEAMGISVPDGRHPVATGVKRLGRLMAPVAFMAIVVSAQAVTFPGLPPGRATAERKENALTLRNDALSAKWSTTDKHLRWATFENLLGGASPVLSADVFVLETSAGRISSSDCVVETMGAQALVADTGALRHGDRVAGQSVTAQLRHVASGVTVQWRAELRDGANAFRSIITLTAGNESLTIKKVTLLDVAAPDGVKTIGTVQASPVAGAGLFAGFESPLAWNTVKDGRMTCADTCSRTLAAKQSHTVSLVLGVYPAGQMRRAFLCYLEQERARPYQSWLHYNTWFDIAWPTRNGGLFTEAEALEVIHSIGRELVQKRGVTLDSFMLDDGWDDVNSVWEFHPKNWPRGFAETRKAAALYGSHVSTWLSPWGGYGDNQKKRLAAGRKLGMDIKPPVAPECQTGSFALSDPPYYKRFHDQCVKCITDYGLDGFKFDGIGASIAGTGAADRAADFDAAIRLFGDLRAAGRNVYLNLTTGTWPSPFWVLLADSTWRSELDIGFHGEGSARQQWITYRDGVTYTKVVQAGPLYPITSLMLHGIVYAENAQPADTPGKGLNTDPGNDFKDEVRSYFATGTQLQELYISHQLLTSNNWDELAEAAKWSRSHSDVLVDNHWVGGDPRSGAIYGWAAWTPNRAVLSLRNPSGKSATITVDAATVFELPEGAPRAYSLTSPYGDQRVKNMEIEAGKPATLELRPFEILVFDAEPKLSDKDGGKGIPE